MSTTDTAFRFTQFLPDPAINDLGQVAFLARLSNGSGLFVGDRCGLKKLVNTCGLFFDLLGTPFEGDVAPAINEQGAIALLPLAITQKKRANG